MLEFFSGMPQSAGFQPNSGPPDNALSLKRFIGWHYKPFYLSPYENPIHGIKVLSKSCLGQCATNYKSKSTLYLQQAC